MNIFTKKCGIRQVILFHRCCWAKQFQSKPLYIPKADDLHCSSTEYYDSVEFPELQPIQWGEW